MKFFPLSQSIEVKHDETIPSIKTSLGIGNVWCTSCRCGYIVVPPSLNMGRKPQQLYELYEGVRFVMAGSPSHYPSHG